MTHEQQPQGEEHDEPRPEREPSERPAIYVASLADYNAGRLHGRWIAADQEAERLHEEVAAMLAASPEPGAEKWAIHDYDNFGPLRLSEYESLERVATIAGGIARDGLAFAHWAAISDRDEADLAEGFDEHYLGYWASLEEYAEHLLDDLGYTQMVEQAVPESLRAYVHIDFAAYGGDLELGGDVVASEGDGGLYLFATR
jgi:antirestriction protein